ncbi:MAG: flagellar biosynthetic protein FliO [Firmicutes bacterium HGW-Firmicutes-13]|nr:MAG: flagellar biosynthetic protein FliO [Firmicutes bacterium HGW-Firmicutes-13]
MEYFALFMKMMLALALVLALAYFSLKLGFPRLYPAGFSRERNMAVVERLALTPKAWLYIVKVGEELLLMGVDGTNITYLKELPPELAQRLDFTEQGPADFRELLKLKLKKEGERKSDESTQEREN